MILIVKYADYDEKYDRYIVAISNGLSTIKLFVKDGVARTQNGVRVNADYYSLALETIEKQTRNQ